jgi:hypothetical protein
VVIAGLAVLTVIAAACGGSSAGPTLPPSPSARVTPSVSAAPTAAPPSATPTASLASHAADPTPSVAPTTALAAATEAPSDDAFPNPNEAMLLAHVDAGLRASCDRADQFYADELDSISCGGDPLPYVDYTLFATVDELRAAFNDDVAQSESQPAPNGTCASGDYQSTYTLGGAPAGRIQCTTRTANGQLFRVIEWTREELRILAYLSSATASWTDMIAFWKSAAGPRP